MPFCNKCGTEVPENVNFCQKCGYALQSGQAATENNNNAEAIWNPFVAVFFGILVVPIATIIHYLNWKTLKQESEAKASLIWVVITVIIEIILTLSSLSDADTNLSIQDIVIGRSLYCLILIIWYFANGKKQVKYVKEKYGTEYKRKSLMLPVIALLAYLLAFAFYGAVLGVKEVIYNYSNDESEFITDSRDGKVYKTVKIGKQIWMAENLNYDDEGNIGKCYDNDPVNCEKYGKLYDWSEAMGLIGKDFNTSELGKSDIGYKGVCPTGWHLPSYSEWDKLYEYIYGNANYYSNKVESKLKAKSGWKENNGTDDYGFSALPGGLCVCYSFPSNKNGEKRVLECTEKPWGFNLFGSTGFWWTATENGNFEAKYWMIEDGIIKTHKVSSMSVRCVRNKGE